MANVDHGSAGQLVQQVKGGSQVAGLGTGGGAPGGGSLGLEEMMRNWLCVGGGEGGSSARGVRVLQAVAMSGSHEG